jgi:hypothetical protein
VPWKEDGLIEKCTLVEGRLLEILHAFFDENQVITLTHSCLIQITATISRAIPFYRMRNVRLGGAIIGHKGELSPGRGHSGAIVGNCNFKEIFLSIYIMMRKQKSRVEKKNDHHAVVITTTTLKYEL